MKIFKMAMTLILLASGAAIASSGQIIDLSGTWTGTTFISDRGVDDDITFVLTKEGDTYTGSVTDSLGLATEAEITFCEFKDHTLTIQFNISDEENTAVRAILNVEGESLVGTWETDAGVIGEIKLERKI